MVGKLDVHNRETTVQVRTYSLFIGYMIAFYLLRMRWKSCWIELKLPNPFFNKRLFNS
jgi:hypothetical protein